MRYAARSTAVVFLTSSLLVGIVACGPRMEGGVGAVPAEASAVSDGGGDDPSEEVAIPAEFTAPIGDGLMLGEERVDTSTSIDEFVEKNAMSVTTYRPILIAPESPLLDYDVTAPYAQVDQDWPALTKFSNRKADAAMGFASRYVVETWMDSTIRMENDPDANLAWFEENKHLYHDAIHEIVRDDLSSPGQRGWVLGAYIPGELDSESESKRRKGVQPAYDMSPTRWTEIEIEPTMAIGGWGDEQSDYSEIVYVRYYVTGNILWQTQPDPDDPGSVPEPLAMPFEGHVAVSVVREIGSDEWKLYNHYYQWSSVGEPLEELSHPWN